MVNENSSSSAVQILLVEDNPGDARLARQGLLQCRMPHDLHVVDDGVKAMAFLNREGEYASAVRPQLILLDLNLPKKDGREVLREIKEHEELKTIPVIILTTSSAERDINRTYSLHANSYITKPLDYLQFVDIVKSIETFWFSTARLPTK
jgi:chemotaxis family two-component system response regulator Rcp1